MLNNVNKGKVAETKAICYLNLRYSIIDYNYSTRYGEIDVICLDYEANEVVFVEVKSTSYLNTLAAVELFTTRKLQKLMRTLQMWLASTKIFANFSYRIDLIALDMNYYHYSVKALKQYKNIGNF